MLAIQRAVMARKVFEKGGYLGIDVAIQ